MHFHCVIMIDFSQQLYKEDIIIPFYRRSNWDPEKGWD